MSGLAMDPRPPTARVSSWKYRPELDGLRTFAVVTIVFFHARVTGFSSSFIVLDLFFVLSGFLVTNVVLSEVDATGHLRLGRYYARRVRRLLPAAVVAIAVTSAVFVLVASKPERLELVRHAQAALLYLANWQFIADGADYFAGDIRSSPFMHFWSLSIEEQYYIVFPLLVLGWLKLSPGRGRVLLGLLGLLVVASVASQLYWAQVDPTRAYFATDARLFQLLAGAALAVGVREFATPGPEGGVEWPRAGRILAAAGVGGYVVFGSELIDMSVSNRNLLATVVAGALVLGTYTAPGSLTARGFSLPWLTYLGKISYGIYLWHWPAILVLDRIFEVRPVVVAVMALVIAVAMASASYQLLETPIRRGRLLEGFHWQAVGAGVTVSVLTAAFVVGPVLGSDRRPAVAAGGQGAEGAVAVEAVLEQKKVRDRLRQRVPRELDFQEVKNDKGPSDTLCPPSSPERCRVVDGDRPHVVLVGDSQARMLAGAFEQLARERGVRFSMSVVTGCPWQHGLYNTRLSQGSQDRCLEARRGFYTTTLPRMEPDVVVLVNLARSDESWQDRIRQYDGSSGPLHEMQREAVDRTVELINEAGAAAVLVKSIMGTEGFDRDGFDPLDCLARAERLQQCVVTPPLERPVADAMYESAAIGNPDAATVDLNPVFCPDAPACRPVVDGQVVWRDNNHVTGRFARRFRDEIWSALESTGYLERSR